MAFALPGDGGGAEDGERGLALLDLADGPDTRLGIHVRAGEVASVHATVEDVVGLAEDSKEADGVDCWW